jgi:hypothetical protein
MSEENYEFDEYGGHKSIEKTDADGKKSYGIPMLGCGTCPASFFKMDARKAHIETMHPTENSGPSEDMIRMARVNPQVGEALGISQEEARAPINVEEFQQHQRISDVVAHQSANTDRVNNHPIMRPFEETMSHVRMMEAAALSNSSQQYHEDIRDHTRMVHEHLLQYAHAAAGNGSVLKPNQHLNTAHDHMDELADYTGNYDYHDGENSEHIAKIVDAAYPDKRNG